MNSTRIFYFALAAALLAGCNWKDGAKDMGNAKMPPAPDGYFLPKKSSASAGLAGSRGSSGVVATEATMDKFLGEWKATIRVPAGAGANIGQVLAAQEAAISKYGAVILNLKKDGLYTLNMLGVKLAGNFRIVSGFLELNPITIMGVTLDEARAKTPKGPDGQDIVGVEQYAQPLNFELITDGTEFKFDQGQSSTEMIFRRTGGAPAAASNIVPSDTIPSDIEGAPSSDSLSGADKQSKAELPKATENLPGAQSAPETGRR
ncbi:MAG: hypothetical protein JNM85_04180 [Chthonomonas sp.]|nr:hypothetical protein [Chthonomonas sp.]